MVTLVKWSSLKQRTPSSFSVVFDMYTENPRNLPTKPLGGPTRFLKNANPNLSLLSSKTFKCLRITKTYIWLHLVAILGDIASDIQLYL